MVLPLYVQLYDTQALLRHRACSKKAGAVSSLVQRAGQPSHQRSQLTAVAAAASFSSSSSTSSSRQQPQEQEQELVRAPSPPPKPVPIIHTTAYLQQTQQLLVPQQTVDVEEQQQQLNPGPDLDSNALVWALKKVDDQLNQVEQQPSEVHQALYNLSNGPVGQATSKGVQVAAKFTMTATIQAAKAAAPVGKWALQQGFKAAVGLVGAAMEQERQSQQRKKQQQGKGSSSGTSKTKAGKNS